MFLSVCVFIRGVTEPRRLSRHQSFFEPALLLRSGNEPAVRRLALQAPSRTHSSPSRLSPPTPMPYHGCLHGRAELRLPSICYLTAAPASATPEHRSAAMAARSSPSLAPAPPDLVAIGNGTTALRFDPDAHPRPPSAASPRPGLPLWSATASTAKGRPVVSPSEFRERSECEDSFDYVGLSSSWTRSSSKRDLRYR